MELVTGSDYSFSWTKFGLTLLSFGLIGPIVEELYFRGLIHTWFQSRFGYGVRVLASSLIFGLSHLPHIGNAFSAFVSGLILVVAYEKSRSIWLSIATHVANNSFLVVVVYWGLAMMARYQ